MIRIVKNPNRDKEVKELGFFGCPPISSTRILTLIPVLETTHLIDMNEIEHLPKCFFNAGELTEALLYIRRCFLFELNRKDMIRELLEHYKTCTEDNQKKALIKLIVAIDEFENPDSAREKAFQYHLLEKENAPTVRSCGYIWLKENILKDGYLLWLTDYREEHISGAELQHTFDDRRYWMVVPPKERENVITICKEADVYCIVEKDLSINIVVMENHPGSYTVDEFGELYDPPKYTSANGFHGPDLISPVYKAKIAKRILEYCLARVGFPYVPIKIKVVYTSPSIKLVNMEYFLPGKYPQYSTSKEWIGVDVTFARDLNPKQGFLLHCPYKDLVFLTKDTKDINDRIILSTLKTSLYVTSKIYQYMFRNPEGEFMFSNRWDIERYAEDLDIFLNNK